MEGVVYFTDGEGPYPAKAPPVPVLWVLTKAGRFRARGGSRRDWNGGGAEPHFGANILAAIAAETARGIRRCMNTETWLSRPCTYVVSPRS